MFSKKALKKVAVFVGCFYCTLLVCFLCITSISAAKFSDIFRISQNRSNKVSKEIVVDTSKFDEYGGITCLTKNIIEQMAQIKDEWRFTLLLGIKNNTILELTHLKNVRVVYVADSFGRMQKIILNLLNIPTFGLVKDKLMQIICYGNVFLSEHTNLFWDPVGGRSINDFSIPKVTTIHDTIEIDKPELFDDETIDWIKERNFSGLKNSHKIITVSEFTKKRVMDIYGIDSEKIRAIPIRFAKRVNLNSNATKIQNTLAKYQISSRNYLIFVSQYYPNKNHKRLIQAFSNFVKNNKIYGRLKLIIVGNMSGSNGKIEKFTKQYGLENNIVFTGRVDDEELSVLLKNALCFVYPSLYEGFGMPLVEAMSCEIPVACSNVSSLPEVAGNAAMYFDPYDISDIEKAILGIVQSPKLRKNLIKKGHAQSKKFENSRIMIDDYIKTFEEVMKN